MREPVMPSSYSYEDIGFDSPKSGPMKMKSVPSEKRNEKCPCGSLRKAKNCRCTTEYMVQASSVSSEYPYLYR